MAAGLKGLLELLWLWPSKPVVTEPEIAGVCRVPATAQHCRVTAQTQDCRVPAATQHTRVH